MMRRGVNCIAPWGSPLVLLFCALHDKLHRIGWVHVHTEFSLTDHLVQLLRGPQAVSVVIESPRDNTFHLDLVGCTAHIEVNFPIHCVVMKGTSHSNFHLVAPNLRNCRHVAGSLHVPRQNCIDMHTAIQIKLHLLDVVVISNCQLGPHHKGSVAHTTTTNPRGEVMDQQRKGSVVLENAPRTAPSPTPATTSKCLECINVGSIQGTVDTRNHF
mmetsp:Transcript_11080/g.68209  ORF Transcript_11080/g.68209 Transcript_11080/m.68209 type:complete len:214 (-) Transcript_11080:1285-1926(-)